jgi:DNA primase
MGIRRNSIDKNKFIELCCLALSDKREGNNQILFMNSRPLNNDTILEWKICYCPPKVNYYEFPYLRGRILIPFYNLYGELISIFGRKLDSNAEEVLSYFINDYNEGLDIFYKWDSAKWINEPYDKSKHLFGLYNNKKEILESGYAILVEGNYDVISLFNYGVKNAVAVCGSQVFSNYHVSLLSRYTNKVVVMMDSDSAGRIGQERIMKSLRMHNFDVYDCLLPEGMDPEDYVRKYEGLIIKEKIKESIKNVEKEILL